MYEMLEVERAGAKATLWMNRATVHNAFNAQLIAEMTAACQQVDADPSIRVVVLAGRGGSFSAGADLNWMRAAAAAGEAENLADAMKLAVMLRTLANLSKPTIARVHGAALAGGMGLAAACDVCVASENATFGTTEVRIGLIPAVIGPYVIGAIGARQAYRYFQTAERLSCQRAHELGLVHERVEPDRLDATVQAMADALLQGGPIALGEAKKLIRLMEQPLIDDALVMATARGIAALRASPEAREGLDAFLSKRAAAWVDLGRRDSQTHDEDAHVR